MTAVGVTVHRWAATVLAAALIVSGLASSAGALAPDGTDAAVSTTSASSSETSPPAGDVGEAPGESPLADAGEVDEAVTPEADLPEVGTPEVGTPEADTADADSPEAQPAADASATESGSATEADVAPAPEPAAASTAEPKATAQTFAIGRVTVRLAPLPRSRVPSTAVTVGQVRTEPAVPEGTSVRVQKRKGTGRWRLETTATTDAAGKARIELAPGPGRWRIRAVVLTDQLSRSNVRTLRVTRARVLQLAGPRRVDGGADVSLRAAFARPADVPLTLQKKRAGTRKWRHVATRTATVATDRIARTRFDVTADGAGTWVYRVVKRAGPGGPRRVSPAHRMRSRPSGPPPFASSVSRVGDAQVRYSHRAGCPVAVSQLRNLSVRYFDYSGSVRTGTVVLRADMVDDVRTVFRRAYEKRFPFKVVKPLEAYYAGGARSPHDSDVAAMNAGNTGAFNCRPVVGNPYRTSQHSYGNAIDYNTIQNPYVTASRVYPSAGVQYLNRSRYQKGMILPGSVVAATMASRGWPWGARWAYPDYQHFSSNGG